MICRDNSTHGWVVGCVSGSMGGSGEITNYLINLDIIQIIQFCLKIYNLSETPPPMAGCMGGWVDGWVIMWVNGWDQVISLKIK